jgi:hypothetical protein
MSPPVDDPEDDDLGFRRAEEHTVRETPQDGPTHLAVDFGETQRPRGHRPHGLPDLVDELLSESRSLRVVPVPRRE